MLVQVLVFEKRSGSICCNVHEQLSWQYQWGRMGWPVVVENSIADGQRGITEAMKRGDNASKGSAGADLQKAR